MSTEKRYLVGKAGKNNQFVSNHPPLMQESEKILHANM